MLIRAARDSDAPMLAAIHRESRRASMPWLPQLHTAAEDLFYFESSVLQACSTIVAQIDGSVIGFCAWRDGWVDHLYVRPDQYRQGIGAALLRRAKDGQSALYAWTFQRNDGARAFLERSGFAVAEMTDGQKNEEKEPDVLYLWRAAP